MDTGLRDIKITATEIERGVYRLHVQSTNGLDYKLVSVATDAIEAIKAHCGGRKPGSYSTAPKGTF